MKYATRQIEALRCSVLIPRYAIVSTPVNSARLYLSHNLQVYTGPTCLRTYGNVGLLIQWRKRGERNFAD